MGSGEREFYPTIYALSSIAGEFQELVEADFAAPDGAAYIPPENEGVNRRVNVARTIQLLKNSPLAIKTSQTNSGSKLRMPCGLLISNDALDGRPYIIYNNGTSNLSIEKYDGTSLRSIKPTQRCIVYHTENDNWEVLFNAKDIRFDNSINGFVSDDVQGAIEELSNGGGNAASPGFTFGRSGGNPTNTWLLCDTVPSNLTGRRVPLSSAKIVEFFASTQNIETYNLGLYSHDGNSINLTLLYTMTVTATRGKTDNVSITIAKDKQLAIKIISGSAANIVAGVIIRGTTT